MNNKNVLIAVAIIIIIIIGFFLFNSYIYQEKQAPNDVEQPSSNELATYFADRMFFVATEATGLIPVEGFDADLLMGAYPGLVPADFVGVEAFEGHYELQGETIEFVRDQPQPVSSAERTISAEGYATLLENVSARLSRPVMTEADVDALVEFLRVEA